MNVAVSEPPLVTLGVSLLWVIGLFALVAMAILLVVGSRLWRGGQVARQAPPAGCGQVRPGGRPVHLSGASAPGPGGLMTGPVSGVQCVWYRDRVYRIYEGIRWREGTDGWEQIPARVQEQIWERESGPFTLRDASGGVLLDPAVVDRRTTPGYPKEDAVDDTREDGPEPWHYQPGPAGALAAAGLLPAGLLEGYTAPAAKTCGYRVTEEVIRPGLSFHLYGVAAARGGEPIMTPVGSTPAISLDGMGAVLTRGGRSATRMALYFGLAGAVCFALSAALLVFHR
jgi:hypothetical protein